MSDTTVNSDLIAHLVDLRKAIIRILVVIFLGFCACVYFSEYIFDFIRAPITPFLDVGGLVFTAPMDTVVGLENF